MRKKGKSIAVIILSSALTGSILTGCGESQKSLQDTQQGTSTYAVEEAGQDFIIEKVQIDETGKVQASEEEKAKQSSEGYEDNFAVDSETAGKFAEKVKDAVVKKDLEALAGLSAFPVYVGLPDVDVVETKEDFMKLGAESVFTDELLKSVEAADIDNLQPSMAGFSISGGGTANINFGVADGVLAINGINY